MLSTRAATIWLAAETVRCLRWLKWISNGTSWDDGDISSIPRRDYLGYLRPSSFWDDKMDSRADEQKTYEKGWCLKLKQWDKFDTCSHFIRVWGTCIGIVPPDKLFELWAVDFFLGLWHRVMVTTPHKTDITSWEQSSVRAYSQHIWEMLSCFSSGYYLADLRQLRLTIEIGIFALMALPFWTQQHQGCQKCTST